MPFFRFLSEEHMHYATKIAEACEAILLDTRQAAAFSERVNGDIAAPLEEEHLRTVRLRSKRLHPRKRLQEFAESLEAAGVVGSVDHTTKGQDLSDALRRAPRRPVLSAKKFPFPKRRFE